MSKQSNKKKTPKDVNQLAAFIVRESTEESDNKSDVKSNPQDSMRG